jgi:hypothetical protein
MGLLDDLGDGLHRLDRRVAALERAASGAVDTSDTAVEILRRAYLAERDKHIPDTGQRTGKQRDGDNILRCGCGKPSPCATQEWLREARRVIEGAA